MNLDARITAHLYLAATIVLSVYSQLVMKWRMSGRFAALKVPDGLGPKLATLFTVLLDPFVFTGLVATFFSGLCWMAVMRALPVSYAYPLTSVGFVLVVVLSGCLLGETLDAWRIAGVLLIVAGIAVACQGGRG